MPSPDPGGTPPEVPDQFADAYRRAYEEALQAGEPAPVADPAVEERPAPSIATRPARPGSHRTRPAWVFPVSLVVAVAVLIGCAYVLGRMVSGDSEAPVGAPEPTESAAAEPTSPAAKPEPERKPHRGKVAPLAAEGAEVGCTADPGVDADGEQVRYDAENMLDGKNDTAWRCDGKAIDQQITLTLPAETRLAEVGLIPGYAKTDATSGVDRYAENNRITRLTWILADGTEVEQKVSGGPKDRSLRKLRVPATEGDHVTLRIDEVAKGKRNTTMISELWLASAS